MADETIEKEELRGALLLSLERSSKEIKKERAADIADRSETAYRRKVEDLDSELRSLIRRQKGTLDLSPGTRDSLILANNFDPYTFAKDDLDLSLEIRQTFLKRNLANKRYEYLFGDLVSFKPVEGIEMYVELIKEE